MAINYFMPTVWSETLYSALDKQYIGVANCNRDFEGEIKEKGSKVRICGVGSVDVSDYTKNTDMSLPQEISDTIMELYIDQAKYFNFQIDDVELAQSSPKLMEGAMKVAASALANQADRFVYTLFDDAGDNVTLEDATSENIVDAIISARTKLYENNVSNASDIIVEVSPAVAELILKAKINLCSDNGEALENGCIGRIAGCKIFVSNNIIKDNGYHKCYVRTKRAISFAEQLSEIEAYRPEKRFADAVKGLHLYGARVIYPREFIAFNVKIAA